MEIRPLLAKSLVLAGTMAPSLWAFDPLMDEADPSVRWHASKGLAYSGSENPTWQASSWLGASKEFELREGFVEGNGSMGFRADDFQLDSAWNVEPRLSARYTNGRLALEGRGWGLWNDLGWSDAGGGADASWILGSPDAKGASWESGLHGWTSGNSGSAIGASLSRTSEAGPWSTGLTLSARRLWDADADLSARGSLQRTAALASTADQWQALFQGRLDRNWRHISAGIGADLDVRALESVTTAASGRVGKGRSAATSAFAYQATASPFATLAWRHAAWSLAFASGTTTEVQLSKGGTSPTTTAWSSFDAGVSW